MQAIAGFFASLYGAAILAGCIIVFGLYQYWFRFRNRLDPIGKELIQANEILKKYPTPDNFYENFEEFKESLEAIPSINNVWLEFKDTLIIPRRTEGNKIFLTQKPNKYFTLQNLGIGASIGGRLNSIPGTLTGLGILGTFIGLTCGIFLAQSGLTAGDTKKVTESLGYLLNGASLAFFTSVAGLLSSIIFAWRKYKVLANVEAEIIIFNSTLSKVMVYRSQESLIFEVLTESKVQSQQLKNFSTELATNIGIALEEKVSGNLSPLLEKIIQGVDNLSSKQSEVGSAAIEQASRAMNENIVNQMGGQMAQLGETFNKLFETLERSSIILNDGQKDLQNQASTIAKLFENSMADSANILEGKFKDSIDEFSVHVRDAAKTSMEEVSSGINASSVFLKESIASMEKAFHKIERTTNSLVDFIDKQQSSNTTMIDVVEKMGKTGTILVQSGQPIERAVTTLDGSINTFSKITQDLVMINTDISSNIQKLVEANIKIEGAWKDYQERFENVDENLNNAFKEIVLGVNSYTERIQSFHQELDTNLSKITANLSGAIGEFGESIEAFTDLMEKQR